MCGNGGSPRPPATIALVPFGPAPMGLVYFSGVKLAGYSVAGRYLRHKYATERPAALTFGIARTLIGLAFGCAAGALLLRHNIRQPELLFLLAILPVRGGEWLLAICFFFVRGRKADLNLAKFALLGTVWSFLLDVPAIISVFVLPGGAWIC